MDADPAVNPAANEACNGYDDDCDGQSNLYSCEVWVR
ncbi:MAG: putative metal-binding motif-containing protein [Alphaproteobacteria bacterium]|nr:putative metal-binding motif-containing protein [Alphaproteobacteria bacterium]